MPIEIRELVIKAAVNSTAAEDSANTSGGKEDSLGSSIQEAIEQMSEIKRKEQER